MPHSGTCKNVWRCFVDSIYILTVSVVSNVTEGVKPCNLYFFIISSSTHCQGKIWEDTLKVGCYKQPLKEIYEILHGHKGKRLVSKLKTQQ